MAGLNKVQLIGNLGSDPEIRYSANNNAVATFNLATTERRKNKEGNWEDRTEWHRIVMFGRHAERAEQFLLKGKQIYLEGRLQTRKWEDRNGGTRWTTEVVCQHFLMLGPSRGSSDSFAGGKQRVNTSGAGNFPREIQGNRLPENREQNTQDSSPSHGGSTLFQESGSKDPFLYGEEGSSDGGKGSVGEVDGVEDDLPF